MSDDERSCLDLHSQKIEMSTDANSGMTRVNCSFVGFLSVRDADKWEIYKKKLSEGLKIHETDSLIHDALAVVQADLEKEKLRYADLERSKSDAITELGQKLNLQQAELERLRKIERDLEALSGLDTRKVVR
jgi:hypothetical protein